MNNTIETKSFSFAVRIVKMCNHLQSNTKEFVLSKQLLRSGTSIGANVREAYRAQSDADFIAKLHIALKEADETGYWLEILYETGYIPPKLYQSFVADNNELIRLLVSILKTKKSHIS